MQPMHDVDGDLRAEVLNLCQALIRLDTTNPPGGETAAAMLLRDYLEAAGVECELVARDPDRANLVARIPGTGTGTLAGLRRAHRRGAVPTRGTGRTRPSRRSSTTTATSTAAARST